MNSLLEKIKPITAKIKQFLSPIGALYKKHSPILSPIIVLTCICLIVAAALSITNSLTEKRIADLTKQAKVQEMENLIPADEYPEFPLQGFENDENFCFHKAINSDGSVKGYIITTSAKGYGGQVVIMTAFTADAKVKTVSIINADDETPGLGQNIKTSKFLSQFTKAINAEKFVLVKNSADNAAGEINAVTSATYSSKAVVNAVNESKEALEKYLAEQSEKEPETPNTPSNEPNIEQEVSNTDTTNTDNTNTEEAGGGVIENQ